MTMMIPVRFQQLMDYDLSVFDFMLIAPTIQEYILPFCHAHKVCRNSLQLLAVSQYLGQSI